MSNSTGNLSQIEEAPSDDVANQVSIRLAPGADIESIVLAYREDGDLVELAERTVPASAELSGELE